MTRSPDTDRARFPWGRAARAATRACSKRCSPRRRRQSPSPARTGGSSRSTPRSASSSGAARGELVGHSLRDFTHPDDIARDDERREVIAGERSESAREERIIRPDGSVTWVRLNLAASSDPASGAPLLVAQVTDVGAGKRQRQALAEAEERFHSAFDDAPIGMALVAPDGRWLKVNRAVCEVCELTGYPETSLLVRSFQDITHPDDLHADLAYLEDLLAGRRRSYQMAKRYYHADGHLIWVMLSVSLVRDADGESLYFVSQVEDITERKRAA